MSLKRIGVTGAGTMGSEIAQLACMGGVDTVLWDPDPGALAAGAERLRLALGRGAERGRWSEDEAGAAAARLGTETALSGLGSCELVIEAAPERLELKRELFSELAGHCGPETVLATNTSSLSVTAIAAEVPAPGRVVGMHFFNPPTRMRLVEIVAGEESSAGALELATDAGRRLGRTPIRARDAIGFVGNRCSRPFMLEAPRMLGERLASHEEIDRVYRLGGGFRMGTFELLDLIGIDVTFAVASSFYEQSLGEPRWRPHSIVARKVASGQLGRKTERGFYAYEQGRPHRPADPEVSAERPILDEGELEAVAGPSAPAILTRLGAQIVNEAAFALDEEVASADDIDTAMRLGFNWPLGPFEWGKRLGYPRALETLERLRDLHGEAYRPAPLLRRLAAGERRPA